MANVPSLFIVYITEISNTATFYDVHTFPPFGVAFYKIVLTVQYVNDFQYPLSCFSFIFSVSRIKVYKS